VLEATETKIAEQQKIAGCLSSLDELIELQAKQLEALKNHKKGWCSSFSRRRSADNRAGANPPGQDALGIGDPLRGTRNADDFRDSMLAFLFLRYLSKNTSRGTKNGVPQLTWPVSLKITRSSRAGRAETLRKGLQLRPEARKAVGRMSERPL
jgi:hypothetical protein